MSDRTDPGKIIAGWWRSHLADRQSGAARGLMARLRRGTGIEALLEPSVQGLAHSLHSQDAARILRLVRVLAELREDSATSFPRLLGESKRTNGKFKENEQHILFRRLMLTEGDDLTVALVRAVRSFGSVDRRACAIARLGRDLWFWDDKTRARWTFDYFGAPAPTPLQETNA